MIIIIIIDKNAFLCDTPACALYKFTKMVAVNKPHVTVATIHTSNH